MKSIIVDHRSARLRLKCERQHSIWSRLSLVIFRQRKIYNRQIAYFFVCKQDVELDELLMDDLKSTQNIH